MPRLKSSTPRDLETVCLKALEKEASRRYRTALELAERPGPVSRGPTHPGPPGRRGRPGRPRLPASAGAGGPGGRAAVDRPPRGGGRHPAVAAGGARAGHRRGTRVCRRPQTRATDFAGWKPRRGPRPAGQAPARARRRTRRGSARLGMALHVGPLPGRGGVGADPAGRRLRRLEILARRRAVRGAAGGGEHRPVGLDNTREGGDPHEPGLGEGLGAPPTARCSPPPIAMPQETTS